MRPYKKNKLLLLILSIVPILAIAFISGQITKTSINNWYLTIHKSSLTPPNMTFPIVWTLLYVMIGLSLWRLLIVHYYKKAMKQGLLYFAIQMILNFLWTPAFFGLQSPLLALAVIIPLWIFIIMTIAKIYRPAKDAALLLIPYLLWVSFALYLNAVIVYLN
ncbi:MAG: tryptophan-rich sensory protein [Chlamydiae bacterium]|nr:tryptophan-rich sensory protein [Chlamydiota bacterium]